MTTLHLYISLLKPKKLALSANFFGLIIFILGILTNTLIAQNKTKIEILNANALEYDKNLGKDARKLIGDVKFKHDDVIMTCDSAYFFSAINSMKAFSNITINQGDSIKLTGDSLNYDGNTKKAILKGNIQFINKTTTLTTNNLEYDRINNLAYFYNGGVITNNEDNSILKSDIGYYHTNSKSFNFKSNVSLVNEDYTIKSDTLHYNTYSETVTFLGPTTITNNNSFIYCENGWYDTKNQQSEFYANAYLYSDDKLISGDTLFYNQKTGYGKINGNANIIDTLESFALQGEIALLYEKKDSAIITQKALLMQYDEEDTLYMHADTFKVYATYIPDSVKQSIDTSRIMLAYNKVKFYKSDLSGKADSVVYSFADSTIQFYTTPILWSGINQLTADFIYIQMANQKVDKIYLNNKSFIISSVDSIIDDVETAKFNQIKGVLMTGFFRDNQLRSVLVEENAASIYYAKDEKNKFIGINKATSEKMRVKVIENELNSISFLSKPEATLYPLERLHLSELRLNGFKWYGADQPKKKEDIFIW